MDLDVLHVVQHLEQMQSFVQSVALKHKITKLKNYFLIVLFRIQDKTLQ